MQSLSDTAKLAADQIKKWRWMIGLHGLASVVFGVMVLAWPGISITALTIVFGAFALATGVSELVAGFSSQHEERGTLVLSGLLGIVIGTMVFVWPSISALALLYVIGAYAVAFGLLGIVAAFRLPLDGHDTALTILSGLVSIVFGIVIFAKPGTGALAVLALIAAFALVTGVSELVIAIGGKKLVEWQAKRLFEANDRTRPRVTPQASH